MGYETPENLFDGVKVKAHKGKHIEFSFGFRQVQWWPNGSKKTVYDEYNLKSHSNCTLEDVLYILKTGEKNDRSD
jgi:hypothetical protein